VANNVLQFPRGYQGGVPQSVEEVHEAVANIAVFHVDETIQPIMGILTETIAAAGFDVEGNQEDCVKDVALVFTALKSMLLKMRGVYHPFQDVCEETFNNEDGVVTFKVGGEPVIPPNRYEELE
jgi:hypothetical protein